ncbi:cytosine/adenosine deaminase-related metal-dependent hydrolase [Mucilaginibacter frigoritolerans]|uniref:Cytosine/adenosine deaminase-related metal-dependent hydrolase n=1 Tax=Mucilaginibacter frigoritolerans TaxID=652788 RepID=A0A562U019_9SPHI|nr:amidohydrolase family protein [Mucilaginibacter frigoritolerans]TWI98724.1 cytosine/adenosine deaminase-related metal-dependent hydrolase [Mucilaginibacter frigoritolerans]
MTLNNVLPVGGDEQVNILINNGKVADVSSTEMVDTVASLKLTFERAMVFPGLINSHDHLDFNLFPQLGTITYNNYTEWGKHIHEKYKAEIAAVLKIPVTLRAQWGVYKNLLAGVTTVINHGEKLGIADDIITVFEETHCLHSVQFEKGWRLKLNNPFKKALPVNIHTGEGNDWLSCHEIDRLIKWNLLRKRLIGVHAVAMTEHQAKKFDAIVWCPESNYFLLNKTARVDILRQHTPMLFGTDSTLTGDWNMWNHLHIARESRLLNDEEIYRSLTVSAAKTWQLNSGEILPGKDADIVVARVKEGLTGFNAFFATQPDDLLLVMHKGKISMFDESLLKQFDETALKNFSKIYIHGVGKYVKGNLPQLIENIIRYYPEAKFPVSLTKSV